MRKVISMVFVIAMLLCACGTVPNNTEEQSSQQETHSSEDVSEATSETETVTETEQHSETERVTESEIESQIPSETETSTETENETLTEQLSEEPETPVYTYTDMNIAMWIKESVNVRDLPSTDGKKLGKLSKDAEVKVTGKCNETGWYRIVYKDEVGYVSDKYLKNSKVTEEDWLEKYIVDTNRDGVVSDSEIKAFEKYYQSPFTVNEKTMLKAGYNNVCDFGDECYGVMVKAEENGRENGWDVIDEYLLKKGLAGKQGSGGNLDRERRKYYRTETEPIYCEVMLGDLADYYSDNIDEKIFEKVYGYKDVSEICSRYVEFGFWDRTIGQVGISDLWRDGDEHESVTFNLEEILYICDFMSQQNPENYLPSCPDPIGKVYLEDDDPEYIYYEFCVTKGTSQEEIDKLIDEMYARAKQEYPNHTYSLEEPEEDYELWEDSSDYIEGHVKYGRLVILMPTEGCELICNQVGEEYTYTFNGITSIHKIDAVEYEVYSWETNHIRLAIECWLSSVEWNHTYNSEIHVSYHCKIFNSAGECVEERKNQYVENGERFIISYEGIPDQYTIVFYNIE